MHRRIAAWVRLMQQPYGVKFGMNLANDRELSFRVEQYDQKAKDLKLIGGT